MAGVTAAAGGPGSPVARTARRWADLTHDEAFDTGLTLLLDGIAARTRPRDPG